MTAPGMVSSQPSCASRLRETARRADACRPRGPGAVLLVGVSLLAADDRLRIHERLGDDALGFSCEDCGRLFWPIVYLPLLALVSFLILGLALSAPRPIAMLLVGGLASLAAAVVLEGATPLLLRHGYDDGDVLYELEVAVEECGELAGWVLLSGGFFSLVSLALMDIGRSLDAQARNESKPGVRAFGGR